jgi:hypothetical protein
MKMSAILLSGLLLLGSLASITANATEQSTLQKCGEAKLTVLFWDVYESALFTPNGSYSPDTRPFRLDIRYLRDISASDLIKQTAKEWRAQGLADPAQDAWLQKLGEIWPDVATGDTLALLVDEKSYSQFTMNGVEIGRIDNPSFSDAFAGIWLSDATTRPALRNALIGAR